MSRLLYRGPALDVLHEEYAKRGRIDDKAPVFASSRVDIEAPVSRVWEILSGAKDWPAIDPTISKIRLPAGVTVDVPFTWVSAGARIRSRFAVVEPGSELTWTGVSYGARAIHRHVLRATPSGGTRLESAESMAGPLLTLMFNSAKLSDGIDRWLPAIKIAAETR